VKSLNDAKRTYRSSEDAVSLGHGGLDVNSFEVLPALLEEGNQEVK